MVPGFEDRPGAMAAVGTAEQDGAAATTADVVQSAAVHDVGRPAGDDASAPGEHDCPAAEDRSSSSPPGWTPQPRPQLRCPEDVRPGPVLGRGGVGEPCAEPRPDAWGPVARRGRMRALPSRKMWHRLQEVITQWRRSHAYRALVHRLHGVPRRGGRAAARMGYRSTPPGRRQLVTKIQQRTFRRILGVLWP